MLGVKSRGTGRNRSMARCASPLPCAACVDGREEEHCAMQAHAAPFQRMPDLSLRPNLIPLHAWLIEAGTNNVATETLFDEFCGRLAAAGVPIARRFLSIAGVHPLRRGLFAHVELWARD